MRNQLLLLSTAFAGGFFVSERLQFHEEIATTRQELQHAVQLHEKMHGLAQSFLAQTKEKHGEFSEIKQQLKQIATTTCQLDAAAVQLLNQAIHAANRAYSHDVLRTMRGSAAVGR